MEQKSEHYIKMILRREPFGIMVWGDSDIRDMLGIAHNGNQASKELQEVLRRVVIERVKKPNLYDYSLLSERSTLLHEKEFQDFVDRLGLTNEVIEDCQIFPRGFKLLELIGAICKREIIMVGPATLKGRLPFTPIAWIETPSQMAPHFSQSVVHRIRSAAWAEEISQPLVLLSCGQLAKPILHDSYVGIVRHQLGSILDVGSGLLQPFLADETGNYNRIAK